MSFISIAYLFFVPIVFCLYWMSVGRWRNAIVVAASCVFYAWWDWRFLGLMLFTCATNYAAALLMERTRRRKMVCAIAILLNFIVLGVFKYYDFFLSNLTALCAGIGWEISLPVLHILLPVGISFYTFQATGYTVDVYRRQTPATRDALQFFAFITFFPQLVAGPIERSHQLLPQFARRKLAFDRPMAVDGMRQILWGLMKKMILADNCAAVADYAFSNHATLSAPDLWIGALCFAFQIYGDFSGYSDIAIGTAKLFGIKLMKNFDRPYLATSIPDFWRRWHISLMTWFRDYVYIPLGGGRCGRLRKLRNTFAVFLLSGLWHGAAWTFVAWGFYHALLFIPFLRKKAANLRAARMGTAVRTLATFVCVLLGWVLFRATDLTHAASYLCGMFDPQRWGGTTCSRLPLAYMACLMLIEARTKGEHPLALDSCGLKLFRHRAARMAAYYLLFMLTLLAGGQPAQFIYFQF